MGFKVNYLQLFKNFNISQHISVVEKHQRYLGIPPIVKINFLSIKMI